MSLTLEEILNRARTRLSQLKRSGDFDVNSAAIREAYEIIVALAEHLSAVPQPAYKQAVEGQRILHEIDNWAKTEGAIPPQTFPDHLSVQKIADEKQGGVDEKARR